MVLPVPATALASDARLAAVIAARQAQGLPPIPELDSKARDTLADLLSPAPVGKRRAA